MKLINGKYHMTKADLMESLRDFNDDQIIFAIGNEADGSFFERPVYKTSEDCAETEVYLYLGDNRNSMPNSLL